MNINQIEITIKCIGLKICTIYSICAFIMKLNGLIWLPYDFFQYEYLFWCRSFYCCWMHCIHNFVKLVCDCRVHWTHEILLNFSDIHNAHSKFIKRYLIAENKWYTFVAEKKNWYHSFEINVIYYVQWSVDWNQHAF